MPTATPQIPDSLDMIRDLLLAGGTILYPTDTIWAIGCDATQEDAVRKVLEMKQQKPGMGLVLLAKDIEQVREFVTTLHPRVETLLQYHARPLTIIYPKGRNLAPSVLAQDGSVAIRIPADEFVQALLEKVGRPLVATCACQSDSNWPAFFGMINSDIIQSVDYVVRYRQDSKKKNEPSVMARLNEWEELDFLRS